MATDVESLIVELDAKVSDYIDNMKKAQGQNEKTDKSILNLTKNTLGFGAKAVGALTAAATAISAVVLASAKSVKETEILARQAKLTADEFKSLAFATKQYGINAEQIADISKDLSDKIGEFAAAGTGPFQDFADVLGLSKDQAVSLATEFQTMSSDQVLGEVVGMMEKAGVSGSQMTFVMESLGNDASRLIPLFKNQSSELDKLRGGYNKINESLKLTKEQQEELTKLSTNWDSLTTSLGNSANVISGTLAPVLNGFINSVIEVVPTATQVIVDFVKSFAPESAEVQALNQQINSTVEQMNKLRSTYEEMGWNEESDIPKTIWTGSEEDRKKLIALGEVVVDLTKKRDALLNPPKADTPEGGDIGGAATGEKVFDGVKPTGNGKTSADEVAEIDALKDMITARQELLISAGATETEILREQKNTELQLLKDFYGADYENHQDYIDAKIKIDRFYKNQQERVGKQTFESMLSQGATQSRALFEMNKLYTASQVALKIPEAVQNSYAWGTSVGGPVAGAAAAAVAFSASIAQLQAVNSQSFGGGSSSSTAPGGGGGSFVNTGGQQQAQETGTTVSVEDIATNQTQVVRIELDGLDTFIEGVSKKIDEGKANGSL